MRHEPKLKVTITPRVRVFPDVLAVLQSKDSSAKICKRFENWPAPPIGGEFEILPRKQGGFAKVTGRRDRPELELVELWLEKVDDDTLDTILNSGQRWETYISR